MGYYKYYIRKLIKSILRWFDKKTLILIILFLLFLCWNNGVFAEYTEQDSAVLHVIALDIIKLNNQVEDLQTKLGHIEADMADIQPDVASISEDVASLSADILDIQQDIAQLRAYASNLGYLQGIDYNIRDIDVKVQSIEYRVNEIGSYVYQMNSNISEIVKYFKQSETNITTQDFQPSYVNGIGASSNKLFNIVADDTNGQYWTTYYFPIEKDTSYSYKIMGSFDYYRYGYCNSVPSPGGSVEEYFNYGSVSNGFEHNIQKPFNYSYFYISLSSRKNIESIKFTKTTTTTTDNPLNIFDNQQKQHEETIANANSNTDKINNTLTDSTVSDDSYNIDTSFTGGLNDSSHDDLLIGMINQISTVISGGNVTTIVIPIPHTGGAVITLSSDLLSKHIKGTLIYTLIQTFWYVAFGIYFFRFGSRAIHWLTSGELLEHGPGKFAEYLAKQNATITSEMM